jgi:hypothetical protein
MIKTFIKKKTITLSLILIYQFVYSQNNKSDSLTFKSLEKTSLNKFLDDVFIYGGFNTSGIYYSNHFRHLSYNNGLSIGAEKFFPLRDKYALFTGLNYTNKNFLMRKNLIQQKINNSYLEVPITLAIELPVFRNFDFRFLLGGNLSYRINSKIANNFDQNTFIDDDIFVYDNNRFQTFDFGWHFGVSAEYKNFIGRIRVLSNFNKLDINDQGMLNTISFELGYYIFRGLKGNK